MKSFFLFFLIVLFPLQLVYSQNIEYVGSTLWSGAEDIVVEGSYGYCAFALGLLILDISDLSTPAFCSQLYMSSGNGTALKKYGNYLYLTDGYGGLKIINVENPRIPTEVGQLDIQGQANDIDVAGNYAYIASSGGGLNIINISDPSSPVLCANFPSGGRCLNVKVAGEYAYINDIFSATQFQIINISNPANPVLAGSLQVSGANGITIKDQYAFLATSTNGISVINISNPANPVLVARRYGSGNGDTKDIKVSGNYAYITSTDNLLTIYDITYPADPQYRNQYNYATYSGSGLFLQDTIAYASDYVNGIFTLNISDSDSIEIIGQFRTYGNCTDVALYGNTACVTSYRGIMATVGIDNPGSPEVLATVPTIGRDYQVAVFEHYALVADDQFQLYTFDLANRYDPEYLSSIILRYYPNEIIIVGQYAYMSTPNYGLQIYDLQLPDSLVWVGEYNTPGFYNILAISGNYAF